MKRSPQPAQMCRPISRRRGLTLIELLVLMSLMASLASTSYILIARMIQSNRHQADTLVRRRTMHLWQSRFLQDGRLAQSAQVESTSPETRRIKFQLSEGAVTYQVIPGGLERLVNGELAGRWELGSGAWEFSLRDQNRIARAEFHCSGELPQTPSTTTSDSAPAGNALQTCVEVALATGSFQSQTPGAP